MITAQMRFKAFLNAIDIFMIDLSYFMITQKFKG